MTFAVIQQDRADLAQGLKTHKQHLSTVVIMQIVCMCLLLCVCVGVYGQKYIDGSDIHCML